MVLANENVESLLSTLSKDKTGVENRSDVDIGVAKALQGIAEAAEDLEGCEASKAETMGEDMMADMMKEFEKLGDKVGGIIYSIIIHVVLARL